MKVTRKGQVTIPQRLREKYGIGSDSEVDFVEEGGRILLKKRGSRNRLVSRVRSARGSATIRMTTDEILKLTRR